MFENKSKYFLKIFLQKMWDFFLKCLCFWVIFATRNYKKKKKKTIKKKNVPPTDLTW